MVISERTGLLTCGICNDDKRYTPKGLIAHQQTVHGRRICPVCECDLRAWPFKEPHKCEEKEVVA